MLRKVDKRMEILRKRSEAMEQKIRGHFFLLANFYFKAKFVKKRKKENILLLLPPPPLFLRAAYSLSCGLSSLLEQINGLWPFRGHNALSGLSGMNHIFGVTDMKVTFFHLPALNSS